MEQKQTTYHKELKILMNEYVHLIYKITKGFPKEELYGSVPQLRRSALSVILNYIEGFARTGEATYKHFLKMSYGLLKESEYLLDFSLEENFLSKENHLNASKMADRIGAMLWGIISKIK